MSATATITQSHNGQIDTYVDFSLARPLSALVPLIKTDLENLEAASLEYKIAVGGKLWEARQHYGYNGVLLQPESGAPRTWLQRLTRIREALKDAVSKGRVTL